MIQQQIEDAEGIQEILNSLKIKGLTRRANALIFAFVDECTVNGLDVDDVIETARRYAGERA